MPEPSAWLALDEQEEPTMQVTMTTDELRAMARSQEKLNVWMHWLVTAVAIVLAGCFLYNVFSIAQPWIRVGQAWIFGVLCYFCGTMLLRGPRRSQVNEPCAHFLEREFEDKRRGFLAIRWGLFLLLPGIAASCWGGGAGPGPFLLVVVVLAVVWVAFGMAANKAQREQLDIRRSIES